MRWQDQLPTFTDTQGNLTLNKKSFYAVTIFITTIILALWLINNPPAPASKPTEDKVISVETLIAKPTTVPLYVQAQGVISPRTETVLIAEVSGKIVKVSTALYAGGDFKAGDVLLEIDDNDYQDALTRAKANLQRTTVEANFSRDEYQRISKLRKQGLASQSDFDGALRAKNLAEAAHFDAMASLNVAKRNLTRTKVIAPYDGFVSEESIDIGQYVSPTTEIAKIYARDVKQLRLPISVSQLSHLDIPTTGNIPLHLQPDVEIKGAIGRNDIIVHAKLVRTEGQINAQSGMLYVVAEWPSTITDSNQPFSNSLPVGLFVKAKIQGRVLKNAYVVPRTVMINDNRLLVVEGNSAAYQREVTVEKMDGDAVVIVDGLYENELIISSKIQAQSDGMKVHINSRQTDA